MQSLHFRFACLRRPTNRHIIYCRFCKSFPKISSCYIFLFALFSGELDMTVNILIQVDKLVQLIESPVFTCKFDMALFE